MIYQIFIEGIPSNANRRGQWARYSANRERQKFRKSTAQIAAQHTTPNGWKPSAFTIIQARHVSPYRRRRDPLGLAERLKGIVDGLVDAGVIPDDDEDHIAIVLARSLRGPTPGIQLTLIQETETP